MHLAPKILILVVQRTPFIAVRQKNAAVGTLHDDTVGNEFGAAMPREIFAEQKVAVALHEVDAFAERSVFAQRSSQGFGRRRGVVSDPVFENVAEQKELVEALGLRFQEPKKTQYGFLVAAGQMQIRNKNGTRQRRHVGQTADTGSLERLGEFESRKLHFFKQKKPPPRKQGPSSD